ISQVFLSFIQKVIKKRESLSRFFIYADCSSSSVNTDSAKISATSIVLTSCSTSFAFVPSLNIVRQNGQALEIIVGSASSSCSVLATLIRFPVVSSVHMSPPPAPQHIPFSRVRSGSTKVNPGIAFKISLGGSYTPL